MGRKFKFVFVPADTSEALEEWEEEMHEGREVECLLDRIKAHFASAGPKKTEAQRRAQVADLMRSLPAGATLTEDMLGAATSMNIVENVSLLANARDNGFVGVNLYVDDEGVLKRAPKNPRATEIAHCCGNHLEVRGDAFLGRVLDDGDAFERLDFSLDEVSSSSAWVAAARSQAEARRRRGGGEELMARLRAAEVAAKGPAVRELTPAEAAKEEGNAAFRCGKWVAAAELYAQALNLDPNLVSAMNNRAMALLKLQRWDEAKAAAGDVLALEPRNVKALLRRAAAREATGHGAEAVEDLRAALAEQPGNAEAAARLAALVEAAGGGAEP
jgi:RNA polymerase II-associated protein 3